jgi:DNA-binding Lrp family transcriptional regulator
VTDVPDGTQELLDALPASAAEVAQETSLSPRRAGGLVGELKRRGIIEQASDGTWHVDELPDALRDGRDGKAGDEPDDEPAPIPSLDAEQQAIIQTLPAAANTIADRLSISSDAALAALDRLREDGITVRYDAAAGKYYLADERSSQLRKQSTLSLSAKTKRAKQHLREEQALLDRLPPTEPLTVSDYTPNPDAETMVAVLGDLHFGDEVRDDRGRVVYDREAAHDAADAFARKVIRNARQWTGTFDECVLALTGDIATGTQIYEAQELEIADLLAQQIRDGAEALTRVATTLREHFDALRIRAVVGNHGFQDPSAARGSNTDLVCYYWMQEALRREAYDDIDIMLGEETHHLNFTVRGWNVHLRHGQDSQQQVDETARSEADWRGWRDKHQFDVGIRGHHHVPSLHWVLNRYPVVTAPSPKPGGEFADRIGDPDVSTPADAVTERKLGYCFGMSADRRITDSRMTDAG